MMSMITMITRVKEVRWNTENIFFFEYFLKNIYFKNILLFSTFLEMMQTRELMRRPDTNMVAQTYEERYSEDKYFVLTTVEHKPGFW